jgi:amino-acid N-acetyltransferase
MNTQLVTQQTVAARPQRRRVRAASARVSYRVGASGDALALHTLIAEHLEEGHLLARECDELSVHAPRFVVAVRRGKIIGGAELAPLSGRVAEIRSLVVARDARALGIGSTLVAELQKRARTEGFETLCAFTHDPRYFVQRGFSIVPHVWVPEKIALDCHRCPLFRRCGQHAVVLPLSTTRQPRGGHVVPLASLRG